MCCTYFAVYNGCLFPNQFSWFCSHNYSSVCLWSCPTFFQKLSIGPSAWTLPLSRRLYAGAPKRTCWGQRKVTRTSLLHFMTLLPAETTRLASLKVMNEIVSYHVSLTNGMRIIFIVIVLVLSHHKKEIFKFHYASWKTWKANLQFPRPMHHHRLLCAVGASPPTPCQTVERVTPSLKGNESWAKSLGIG